VSNVEDLLRYWGKHAALTALRRRMIAPVLRERIERFLDARGWPWDFTLSSLIDRCVQVEDEAA
jgi:hypothetical protein